MNFPANFYCYLLLIAYLQPCWAMSQEPLALPTPFMSNNRFYNSENENSEYLWESLKIFWATKTNAATYYAHPNQITEWVTYDTPQAQSKTPVITWLGHSSFLIQINNINILTDPAFYDLSIMYPRNTTPGILPQDLPPIDVIIISHNHRDHFDENSLQFIQKKYNPLILVPCGLTTPCHKLGFSSVTEMTWWEKHETPTASFTFLPAHHWSNRGSFDINKTLWGSWMIQANGYTIYFAGDSAYAPHFKTIGQQIPSINIALLPIGPNEPRELMKQIHMSAEEAGKAFLDLHATVFIPMHWGTFRLGTDSFVTPIQRLSTWWQSNTNELTSKQLVIPKFGQKISFTYPS